MKSYCTLDRQKFFSLMSTDLNKNIYSAETIRSARTRKRLLQAFPFLIQSNPPSPFLLFGVQDADARVRLYLKLYVAPTQRRTHQTLTGPIKLKEFFFSYLVYRVRCIATLRKYILSPPSFVANSTGFKPRESHRIRH